MPVFIEISAVVSRMVENSVQNDADAVLCTFPDKFSEQLICTKRRIDLKIVACIIAMIE